MDPLKRPDEFVLDLIGGLPPHEVERVLSKLDKDVLVRILSKIVFERKDNKDLIKIPVSIFSSDLSISESLALYLRQRNLRNKTIARLLGRSPQVVWAAINKAKQKVSHLRDEPSEYDFFVSIFSRFKDANLSLFETIVYHLRTSHDLSHKDIARLLGRDSSTINTIFARARKKIEQNNKTKNTTNHMTDV